MSGTARQSLIEKITEIATRAAAREGIEVWNIELAGSGRARVLRIYIDKPEGVSHADCELISNQVGTVLDVENVMPGERYQLEVSSPGVERKLLRPEHYQRFQGQKALITLREPLENRRRWEGTLGGFDSGCVILETPEGQTIRPRMEEIEKANLKFEW
ncbi:MAG: ribosome maturation factor RimP [Acidobacteria bacterium]|nr:ribosome maturation factor RimP [Acidobacteriota bacterium]